MAQTHPTPINWTLRDLRLASGREQGEVAETANVSRSQLSRFEHGRTYNGHGYAAEFIWKVARALGLELDTEALMTARVEPLPADANTRRPRRKRVEASR